MKESIYTIIISGCIVFGWYNQEEPKTKKTFLSEYNQQREEFICAQDSVIQSRDSLIVLMQEVIRHDMDYLNRMKIIAGVPDSVDFSYKTKCIYQINSKSILKDFSDVKKIQAQRLKISKLVE